MKLLYLYDKDNPYECFSAAIVQLGFVERYNSELISGFMIKNPSPTGDIIIIANKKDRDFYDYCEDFTKVSAIVNCVKVWKAMFKNVPVPLFIEMIEDYRINDGYFLTPTIKYGLENMFTYYGSAFEWLLKIKDEVGENWRYDSGPNTKILYDKLEEVGEIIRRYIRRQNK